MKFTVIKELEKYNNNVISKLIYSSKNTYNSAQSEAQTTTIDLRFDNTPPVTTKLLENTLQRDI